MTIKELRALLAEMPLGGEMGITNEVYAMIFLPGKPDMNAQVHCGEFAKVQGCRVENSSDDKEVVFTKM